MTRRALLGGLGSLLGLVGLMEFLSRRWPSVLRLSRSLPDPFSKKSQGFSLSSPQAALYADFLQAYSLRYISSREVILPHDRTRNGVRNTLPPRELWSNLPPTLLVADEIRHRLGAKLIRITSAYRSPEYNAQCSGAARRSYHTQNMALDLVYDCDPKEVYEMAEQLRKEGFFKGGIGLYLSFVHIDTRGRNATWGLAVKA